ncbi:hypothetical protein [Belliella pelovolcani]|uniref:6-bladed beta-propeller protein n=1 Tax=Belliella pelovolcani TaxID=529505 RepID=A0A1N7NI91_9BACT|nr:hypothetical protein [Belliella pelovolcani]SIS98143.1 hypothetical protein SAMN05421761_11050 [Belliella pelovolcani]
MKQIIYLYLVLVAIISCSSPKEQSLENEDGYSLVIVDSLEINVLGSPMLVDVSPMADRFAFYDYSSKEFLFTDRNGAIIGRFSKKGDTPDAYGFLMEFPGFIDEEQVALAGMNGVFVFDLGGNMVKKMSHPESLGGAGFMSFVGKGMETVNLAGKPYLLSKSVRTRDTYPGEQRFYDEFKAIELIDIEHGEFTEIVPFEEGSLFLNGNGFYESDYAPALEASGDRLYVALGGEPKLRVYKLNQTGAELESTVDLIIPGFEKLPLTSREEFYKGSVTIKGSTPAIRNIHVVDDYLILHYYGGIPENIMKELDALWESGDQEESERLYAKAAEEVSQGMLILEKESLIQVGNIPFMKGVSTSGFASGDGFLWMQRSPNVEEEEDFLRVYKVKLVRK